MARKDIALSAALGSVPSLSQTLMTNRLTLQISSLASNGVPEYYLLLAACNSGNEQSFGVASVL